MTLVAFLFLYGITAILGVALGWFWLGVARKRVKVIEHAWHQDLYTLVALGFGLVTAGLGIGHSFRTFGNIHYGLSPILQRNEGVGIGVGMIVVLLGFLVLIYLADIEDHPPKWTWVKVSMVVSVLWVLVVLFIADMVPTGF